MALGKGIPVINGFDLNSQLPLDSRTVADTKENMNKLVTDGSVGDGQLCYCKADKKLYVLKDNVWSEVGGEGKGLNILSLNLKDHMNESDYNELVGYILQKTVIAKAYNITLPDLTGIDIVKFTVETPVGNISTTFYRNSKAMTQFNWLCNWADNENFMQMVTITGDTDNNVNYIKYNGIDSGGGGGVSPTLNLMDFSGDSPEARTSITEEEYNNYSNNLYSSVYFMDGTLGNNAEISTFLPELIVTDIDGFTIYKVSMDDETSTLTPTHIVLYRLKIGEKDAISGNYPITIEKQGEFPLGSSGGSSTSSDSMHVIIKKETNGKITLTEAEFDNLAKDDYELAITTGNDLFIYDEKSVIKDSSTGSVASISFMCSNVRGMNQLVLMNTSSVEFTRNNLVSNIVTSTSIMTQSKLFNKKVMTYGSYSPENILPCTASDNGKVLSVVNGEAQWASASGSGSIPSLPADASTSTYVLKAVNGTVQWVKEA